MNLIKLVTGKPCENTYIVSEDGVNAVIIDPGDDIKAIVDKLNEHNLVCKAMLVTHAHFDHCNACRYFQEPVQDRIPVPRYGGGDRSMAACRYRRRHRG